MNGSPAILLFLISVAISSAQNSLDPPKLRLPVNTEPLRVKASLWLKPGQDQFKGHVDLDVKVVSPTRVIWLNARSLQFQSGSVTDEHGRHAVRLQIFGQDFLALVADTAISGPAHIEIEYTGEVSRSLSDGAFQQQQGEDWYIFTKFEPVTARRVFPCFDEPSYKVPWQLTLTAPTGLKAYSNTPSASTKDKSDGTTVVRFEETKPLPSYLIAFAVGPFEEVPTEPIGLNRVPGRIIVPRGRSSEARYAASVTPPLIGLLENYFGRPYPYPKLDQIVVPITGAWGAMENAGLIAYGNFLLAPPQQMTELTRNRDAQVMEHEMAHQWFGDLVTMAWWNDLWLNEAFASWVESKLLNEWKPEWNIKADTARSSDILHFDSLTTARKIRQPIEAPGDIANAFDGITYAKGEAVIGMFENYVGPEAFQKAVRLYLSKHEWGNATSTDLLSAIEQISPQSDADAAFSTFLNQVGFPLLTVEQKCVPGDASIHVSQKRFAPVGSEDVPQEIWQVPVCMVWGDETGVHRQCNLLSKTEDVFKLVGGKNCPAWLSLESNAAGYYAVEYQQDMLQAMMHEGLSGLSAAESAAMLRNDRLLFSSGVGRLDQELAFAFHFSRSSDPGLVRQSAQLFADVRGFVTADSRDKYRQLISGAYGPKAHELGWIPKPGEPEEVRLLRITIVPLVAKYGNDAELQRSATTLAGSWLSDKTGIDPDMVTPVLSTAAWGGNRQFFDRLVDAIKQDKVQRERSWMIPALAGFRDPALAQAALELLLQPGIDPRELQYLVLRTNDETRSTVWAFVQKNFDRLNSTLPGARGVPYGAILPLAASGFCDAEHGTEVDAFFKPRMAELPGGARNLANTLESIRLCDERTRVTRPAIAKFLAMR